MNGADKVRHTLRLNGELWSRCIDRKNHSIIEAGCIREFTRMSYPEMGELLGTSGQYLPVALTRAGRSSIPTTDTILESCDLLNVSATAEGFAALRASLAGKEA